MSEDPSNSKSWMRVISTRFHASHHSLRSWVSCPFSRGIPSWTINLPSCRHSLDVKTGTRLEWLLNWILGEGLQTEKVTILTFHFHYGSPVRRIVGPPTFVLIFGPYCDFLSLLSLQPPSLWCPHWLRELLDVLECNSVGMSIQGNPWWLVMRQCDGGDVLEWNI